MRRGCTRNAGGCAEGGGERYTRRHHDDGGRRLYVSSGLGTSGMPVRLLAPPEVVLLELRSSA